MGNLGGADHHHTACLHIGEAAVVFNMTVLDRGGIVPALHLDEARFLPGFLVVALADVGVFQDVAGELVVNLGGVRLHGLLHIQNEGQFLVLHLQRPDSLGRRHLVLRDDHGHIVAVVPHMAVQQQAVCHVLMTGVRGPGVARRGEREIGNIEAGQDPDHAGDILRLRGVDGLDETVGDGGMADLRHQGFPAAEIVHVFRAAGGLFIGVHPDDAFADAFAHMAALLIEVSPRIDLQGRKRIYYETDARDTIGDKRYGVLFQDRMRGDGRGQCPAVR